MNVPITGSDSLTDWIVYLESLHPKAIEMGLDRVNQVKLKLGLVPFFPIIIVGGTNGKGSVCTMLESILFCAGYKVGCYTSPHLLKYNERIRISKRDANDRTLCQAFEQINTARNDCQTSLTFFEFGTLAAMWVFIKAQVDVAILEVGLGGRLDAVNVFDADCSIVTNIDLDHIEYLGETREKIGLEKVAIFRKDKPAVCSETRLPDSVNQQVKNIGATLFQIEKEFGFLKKANQWDFWGPKGSRYSLPYPTLRGEKQLHNASTCLAALDTTSALLPVSMSNIRQGLIEAVIPGRFQVISTQPMIILDVTHNVSAASVLSANLAATKPSGHTYAIFAMLQDKDINGVITELKNNIDYWLVSTVYSSRAATVGYLTKQLFSAGIIDGRDTIYEFPDCVAAFVFACEKATKNDRICVFGSFYAVSDVLHYLNSH